MKMKLNVLGFIVAASVTVPVLANERPEVPHVPQFSEVDTQTLFEQGEYPLQLAKLSGEEMKETEGAWVQFAIGGAIGAAGYGWGYYRGNYAWNTASFLGNVGTGALIGGGFGALGSLASGGARFIPSLTNAGANIWRFNSAAANFGANRGWRR